MKVFDSLITVVTVLALVLVLYGFLRADGPVGNAIAGWDRQRETAKLLSEWWPELTRSGSRLGSRTTDVRLVEFADFECPACRGVHQSLTELLDRYPDIAIVYRHFPLTLHPAAEGAARAAICAEAQEAFEELHNRFFETSAWRADTNWIQEAQAAGVQDLDEFGECLMSDSTSKRLMVDKELVATLGLTGTPTFITREQIVSGVMSDSALADLIGIKR